MNAKREAKKTFYNLVNRRARASYVAYQYTWEWALQGRIERLFLLLLYTYLIFAIIVLGLRVCVH